MAEEQERRCVQCGYPCTRAENWKTKKDIILYLCNACRTEFGVQKAGKWGQREAKEVSDLPRIHPHASWDCFNKVLK